MNQETGKALISRAFTNVDYFNQKRKPKKIAQISRRKSFLV